MKMDPENTIREHIKVLCESIGPRPGGSPGNQLAAELDSRVGIMYGDLTKSPISPKSWFLKSERDDRLIHLLESKRPLASSFTRLDRPAWISNPLAPRTNIQERVIETSVSHGEQIMGGRNPRATIKDCLFTWGIL